MGRERGPLALAQAARQVDDGVAAWQLAGGRERVEQLRGERAAACAELPHLVGAGGLQGLSHLARQRVAIQRGELGRGHEVAALTVTALRQVAELGRAVGVVAQTGFVQSLRHEAIKRQPASGVSQPLAQARQQGAR